MVVLGSDSHKNTHTIAAVDGNGVLLEHKTVEVGLVGQVDPFRWAQKWPERRWAWRIVGTYRVGWSPTCCGLVRAWCGCRRS